MSQTAVEQEGARSSAGSVRWRLPALLLLMLAYVVSGRLGLLLAVPPGYASAIFPPAGIALAAALCGGWITLPAIFAGSLILNLWVSLDASGHLDARGVAAGLLIALASTLQAAIGGIVLRRSLGWPTPLDRERSLLRFALLAPLICVTSASISVTGLHVIGFIASGSVASSGFTWWIGDTLGVLVMMPLTMVLVGEPRALWRSRAATLAMPILIGFCLFVAIFVRLSHWEQKQSLLEFTLLSRQTVDRIEDGFDDQELLLEQVERLFSGSEAVTREQFRHFVEKALQRYPMVRAIEWVPEVPAAQRAAYEQRSQIVIAEFSGDLSKRYPAPVREAYYPVTFIEPLAGNEMVPGVNIAIRVGADVLKQVAASGRATMTPPFTLVQDRAVKLNPPVGGLILYPVQAGANGRGYVATVLRVSEFIEGLLQFSNRQLYTRLEDVDAGRVVYDNFAADAASPLFVTPLEFGGRHYRLQMTPTPVYVAAHRGWQSWGMLVAGLLFLGLLATALLLSTGHAARTEAEVALRTAALRDEKAFSEAVINYLPGVFYMLDASGRLVHWNRNFMTVFNRTEEDLRTGDVLQSTLKEDQAMARDAITRILQTRGYEEIELRQHVAGGQLRRYLGNGQYVEIAGKPYILGTGVDITDRREMEQEMQRSRTVLRTLIDAAPVWMAMVNREGNMVIANRRLSETFGLPQSFIDGKHYSAVLPPETSVRMQSLLDTSFAGREVEFSDEWSVTGLPTMYVHGKCVPVMDGGTAVSVVIAIMDMTEMHDVQSSLRTTNAALERRVDEIRKLQVLLQEQAIRDPLTGLYNRRYLDETLEAELIKAQRAGYPVSIVMGDIDRFKKLNDTYGHQAGDQVIRMLADLLREHARASDILCRYGGEEFLLVLPQMTPQDACIRMETLRRNFAERRIAFGAFELAATISFGVSAYPDDGKVADRLIAAADHALYEAKAAGRNRIKLARA